MLWILIGYMFLFVHRPFEIWPALGEIHLERFYMIAALLAAAIAPGKRWLPNWQHVALVGFAAAVGLCWMASPWSEAGEQTVENYFKVLIFYLLIVLLVQDERGLRRLLLGFLGVMFVYMAHSLWEYAHGRHVYRMGICRLIGVDKTMGDPNTFGASVVYALPLVVPFWLCRPSGPLRAFLVAYMGLSTMCIGLTGSRSSLLGLLVNIAVAILRSRHRKRAMLLGIFALPLLWWALPESLQDRFHTIVDPSVGPKSAQASGEGRLVGFYNGLALYGRFPLTGCGPGAWKPATRTETESHCLYGQLPGEMGTVGVLAFLGVLAGFGWNLWQIRKAYRQHPEWGHDFPFQVAVALGLAVLLLLFEGIGGHNLFRYSWLWYGGFLIIARHCVDQRLACAWRTVPRFTPRPAWGYARPAFSRGMA